MNKIDLMISICCTILGVVFTYLSFNRKQKRDIEKDTRAEVEAITRATEEMKHVSSGINDIKLDIRQINQSLTSTNEKVIKLEVKLEEGLKLANKRIDDLGGK